MGTLYCQRKRSFRLSEKGLLYYQKKRVFILVGEKGMYIGGEKVFYIIRGRSNLYYQGEWSLILSMKMGFLNCWKRAFIWLGKRSFRMSQERGLLCCHEKMVIFAVMERVF